MAKPQPVGVRAWMGSYTTRVYGDVIDYPWLKLSVGLANLANLYHIIYIIFILLKGATCTHDLSWLWLADWL